MSDVKKWKPSAEQRKTLEALVEEQQKEESQQKFADRYLTFGKAQWNQIIAVLDDARLDSYFDRISDPDAKMAELEETLVRIQLQRASETRADDSKLLPLSHFLAVKQAVKEAKRAKGPERLIKYLAPTGGGKSMLAQYLAKDNNLRVVESREAWRGSYYSFLIDICRAIKLTLGNDEMRPAAIEDKLIPALCQKENDMAIVIYIDEAEFFGREALNGLKLLLNKTRMVPVIGAIPEAHDRWNRYYPMEADQIARRTREVIQLSVIDDDDCALFFPANQFAEPKKEIKWLAQTASKFGHYSLLKRVARKISGVERADESDVRKAVRSALTTMRRMDRIPEFAAAVKK